MSKRKAKNQIVDKYVFHIGSNNTTKKIELKKALKILSRTLKGFNYSLNKGYYTGYKENSFNVEFLNVDNLISEKTISELKKELETKLKQDLVLIEKEKAEIIGV